MYINGVAHKPCTSMGVGRKLSYEVNKGGQKTKPCKLVGDGQKTKSCKSVGDGQKTKPYKSCGWAEN